MNWYDNNNVEAIMMVASNLEGLNTFLNWTMISFVVICLVALVIEQIYLNLLSKRCADFVNNTNTADSGITAQEGTMDNNNNNNNPSTATPVVVTEETVRERITNWFQQRREAKIEKVEKASTARVQSLQAQIEELQAEIASEGTALKGKIEKAEKPGLVERAVKAGFEQVDKAKARWSAFKQAVRAKLIQKLDAVPREDFEALEERVAALESVEEVKAPNFNLAPPMEVQESPAVFRKEVERLIAEAEEILVSDRARALAILRDSEIAKKYKVPTNLNFLHTRKAFLRLIA